ncbi:alpha/beta hydrolase [Paraflavitalea soli]|uniref:Alpha/beta hydrolase n=1 Tax=Paraflavitalea soli TaxID=2315862 RepID=A0A3B7MFV8_9BACT|nr:alpha/beta hydrolase [Paraflavitalea soli]AXY73212.1 alpha/beta hydrolase [Paraflavitalea soli]
MSTIKSKTVMFVTGAFVIHRGWDEWQKYFQSKGYNTIAPPWPNKEAETAQELRDRQPNDVALATTTLAEVIDSYAKHAESLPEKPIIIGHSLGGMMTQILVNRGYAVAGVAIHPVPPLGVFPYELGFLRGGFKSLGLFTSVKKTYLMSLKDWQFAFVNGMPLAEQKAAWEANTIPESKTVSRGGLSSMAKLDWKKPHVPLLITSGSEDNIIPAHLNYRNYKAYKQNGSVLDYKEFKGRNHFVLGQSTWKEDADYILDWLAKL